MCRQHMPHTHLCLLWTELALSLAISVLIVGFSVRKDTGCLYHTSHVLSMGVLH